ncbi:hypothetical protein GCM10011350_39720 [Marinomonas arctica]|nr:hypothetical protein GCM10011350_39720 [Marinomonas arctica]
MLPNKQVSQLLVKEWYNMIGNTTVADTLLDKDKSVNTLQPIGLLIFQPI